MRPLIDVLQVMIGLAPEEDKKLFSSYLKPTIASVPYTAPEIMHIRWREAQISLMAYAKQLPDPEKHPEWFQKALEVFLAVIDYKDYLPSAEG